MLNSSVVLCIFSTGNSVGMDEIKLSLSVSVFTRESVVVVC